jgi:PTS system beta-glucosides-specific IIC component
VPFLAMLVMLPVTAFIIGPIGIYVGIGLGGVLSAINGFSPLIFALVIPMLYPFLVPLGLHWPLNAIMLANISTYGEDFIQGPMGVWNFACFGATAGVLILAMRDKEVQMRQTATGALAAGLLGGISEPSLYGIHLRFKKIYPRMLVGCFVGGLTIGIGGMLAGGGVMTNAFVFTSLLTIPAFSNIPLYALSIAVAFGTAMMMVLIFDYRTPEQKAAARRAGAGLDEAPVVETKVIVVGDVETNQAKQWVAALGGEDNISAVQPIAETRVRVEVGDSSKVDAEALRRAGLAGAVEVSPGVWHLVAGLDAEQYAEGMRRRLASVAAAV